MKEDWILVLSASWQRAGFYNQRFLGRFCGMIMWRLIRHLIMRAEEIMYRDVKCVVGIDAARKKFSRVGGEPVGMRYDLFQGFSTIS